MRQLYGCVIGASSFFFGGRFIYSFMGVGILVCCIALIGCIAAEAISGCCLCFVSCNHVAVSILFSADACFKCWLSP